MAKSMAIEKDCGGEIGKDLVKLLGKVLVGIIERYIKKSILPAC